MLAFPLMEGEGKSFRVLGFNQSQRALFVQVLMRFALTHTSSCIKLKFTSSSSLALIQICIFRFGVGEFDWAEFVPRLKQKTYEEIKEYVHCFFVCLNCENYLTKT